MRAAPCRFGGIRISQMQDELKRGSVKERLVLRGGDLMGGRSGGRKKFRGDELSPLKPGIYGQTG